MIPSSARIPSTHRLLLPLSLARISLERGPLPASRPRLVEAKRASPSPLPACAAVRPAATGSIGVALCCEVEARAERRAVSGAGLRVAQRRQPGARGGLLRSALPLVKRHVLLPNRRRLLPPSRPVLPPSPSRACTEKKKEKEKKEKEKNFMSSSAWRATLARPQSNGILDRDNTIN